LDPHFYNTALAAGIEVSTTAGTGVAPGPEPRSFELRTASKPQHLFARSSTPIARSQLGILSWFSNGTEVRWIITGRTKTPPE